MRRIAVLDAPSNLGLRPPTPTSVPGCAKAPGALRDHGLLRRLNARDAGCLTPPRYDPGDWRPGDGVSHAAEISAYSRKLADRIGAILDLGEFPVILGGDCSIVLGSALAMHRLGEAVGGRIGLVFVDGHSDFRHPGNASYVGAAAGEDLALVTGRGQTDLAAMEGRRPYYRDIDVVVMGIRAQDEYRLDLQAAGIVTRPVPTLRVEGAARSAQWARDQLIDCAGYWVHIDVDVLDPAVMPAVDAPEPGGIAFPELEILLAGLVESPHCLGVEITVFDPDYDPDGKYAEEITSAIVAGLQPAQLVDARPDLVAARRDLAGPGRLAPGRLGPGQHSPDQLPPGQLSPGRLAPGRLAPGPRSAPAERDPVEVRRAAAAGDSVRLAAAAMSGDADVEETAAPATTLLGVEDGGEVAAYPGTGDEQDAADRRDEFQAVSDRADEDDDEVDLRASWHEPAQPGVDEFVDLADGGPIADADLAADTDLAAGEPIADADLADGRPGTEADLADGGPAPGLAGVNVEPADAAGDPDLRADGDRVLEPADAAAFDRDRSTVDEAADNEAVHGLAAADEAAHVDAGAGGRGGCSWRGRPPRPRPCG
jgi:arginase